MNIACEWHDDSPACGHNFDWPIVCMHYKRLCDQVSSYNVIIRPIRLPAARRSRSQFENANLQTPKGHPNLQFAICNLQQPERRCMTTERLYFTDPYLTNFSARIVAREQ